MHVQKLIQQPDIILCNNPSPASASLTGHDWQNPSIFPAIIQHNLPHLKDLLVTFLHGSSTTWIHFTSDFMPGGLIDEATTEEHELAWMPATNDENEGSLG